MGINKKMYKYTAIISMTIVLILIFNLVKPMLTIADSTYGISSINYDKNEAVMTVTCTRSEEHVNSFLYWVSTEEDIPTKDNLDELAIWCVKNAIKVVPLNSTSLNDSIKIRNTGKYYAVMLLKKANEEGTEEYVKAFVATYVVNTPIKEDDLEEEIVEEEIAGTGEEVEEEPAQEPVKEVEVQPAQEPVKEVEVQPVQQPEKEAEPQPAQEPEQQPVQESKKESEVQQNQEEKTEPEEDKPLYVQVNPKNETELKDDEYLDIQEEPEEKKEEEIKDEKIDSKQSEQAESNKEEVKKQKNLEELIAIVQEEQKAANKDAKKEVKANDVKVNDEKVKEVKTNEEKAKEENTDEKKADDTKIDALPMLTDVEIDNQAQETIPQTGSNDVPLIMGIVLFTIIGVGSFIKYLKIN